jgi:hypothetical protein
MKTAPIRIHTPPEPEVRTVIPGEDGLGLVFIDVELCGGRLADEMPMLGQVGVGGIPHALRLCHG